MGSRPKEPCRGGSFGGGRPTGRDISQVGALRSFVAMEGTAVKREELGWSGLF
jgi:hypothetical protein